MLILFSIQQQAQTIVMDVEFVPEATKRVQKDGVEGNTPGEAAEAISLASRRTFHNSQGAAWILSLD